MPAPAMSQLFQEKKLKLYLFVISWHRIFALYLVSLFERDSFFLLLNVNVKYLLLGFKACIKIYHLPFNGAFWCDSTVLNGSLCIKYSSPNVLAMCSTNMDGNNYSEDGFI